MSWEGKAPSIEHPSHAGPPPKKRKKSSQDPTYVQPEETPKEESVPPAKRGRVGRGRGRGVAQKAATIQTRPPYSTHQLQVRVARVNTGVWMNSRR